MRLVLIVIAVMIILVACYTDCRHENRVPSKEINCKVIYASEDLKDFLFFLDSATNLKSVLLITQKEQLTKGDLISFYNYNNFLASYKILEANSDYVLLQTHLQLGLSISWKPETKKYRLKKCQDDIRIFKYDGNDQNTSALLVLHMSIRA